MGHRRQRRNTGSTRPSPSVTQPRTNLVATFHRSFALGRDRRSSSRRPCSHTLSTAIFRSLLLTLPGPLTPTLPAEAARTPPVRRVMPPPRPLDARRRHCLRRRNTPPARRDLPERARQAGVRGISVPPRTTQPRTPALPMGHQLSCCRLSKPPRDPGYLASIIYSGEISTVVSSEQPTRGEPHDRRIAGIVGRAV